MNLRLCLAGAVCFSSLLLAEPTGIRRLDGTVIPFAEAEAFARATLEAKGVTGAQIAVIDRGKVVWKAAFGQRRLDPKLPMETSTNTWAASITKAVFTTYATRLAMRGEISLDVPLLQQLGRGLDTFEAYKETGSAIAKDPRLAKVTPRMLLSHTAGLGNLAFFEPDKKIHFHSDPGSMYRYSGEGINLVQLLVEQKKGRPIDVLLQEEVFGPLGMTQTGMIYREEFAANVADRFDGAGKFIAQTRRFPARAAGSMTTSVDDLAKFTEALLKDPILRVVTKPAVKIRSVHQFPVAGDAEEGEEAKRVGLAYGLGWGLLTKTRFGPAFFKEGHGDGAQTYMICFARRKACLLLLTNSDNGEKAYRPLLEKILGNTVTPWEWQGWER